MATPDEPSIVLLFEPADDPDLRGVAAALERALAAPVDADDEPSSVITERSGATVGSGAAHVIALPVPDGASTRLEGADVAIALDPVSAARARASGVRRVVLFAPRLELDAPEDADADLLLVTHEALVEEAQRGGLRARSCGPVARDEWTPAEDRAALKAELGLDAAVPWVVVRAAALADDPAAALVQLALVRERCVWLFDVGGDAELARTLRRRVPGYALDAVMFADGPDALPCYRAADAVLGALHGPEMIRALSVGAALIAVPARARDVRVADALEAGGAASVADTSTMLAVAIDAALEPRALARAREAGARLDATCGAARAVAIAKKLGRGELEPSASSGLPRGLERLSEPETERAAAPRRRGDLEASVDEELAALRKKLGL